MLAALLNEVQQRLIDKLPDLFVESLYRCCSGQDHQQILALSAVYRVRLAQYVRLKLRLRMIHRGVLKLDLNEAEQYVNTARALKESARLNLLTAGAPETYIDRLNRERVFSWRATS